MTILSWICRIIVAIILLQTLFFKFTGAEESKYIFTTLMGAQNEWIGRIGSGVVELIAAVLLLIPLAQDLSRSGRRVIVPDLPGFGSSTENIPDYSVRALGVYLLQLADKLKIENSTRSGFRWAAAWCCTPTTLPRRASHQSR